MNDKKCDIFNFCCTGSCDHCSMKMYFEEMDFLCREIALELLKGLPKTFKNLFKCLKDGQKE